jgi:hypothetical protein
MALSNSRFFDFSSLSKGKHITTIYLLYTKGKYIVKLHTTLSPQLYSFQLPEEVVTLDQSISGSGVHLKLNFTATVNQASQEVTATPFFGLVFAVAIFFGVLNYQMVQ